MCTLRLAKPSKVTAKARHYAALDLVRFEPAKIGSVSVAEPISSVANRISETPVQVERKADAMPASELAPPKIAGTSADDAPLTSSERDIAKTMPKASPAVDPELAARVAKMDWRTLQAELARRSRPPASQGVFGVGNPKADLFVIGEAPGADEDRLGEPFVGRAGKLLDAMLGAISHSRQHNVYIANICKFRPPDNRDPRPEEVAEDLPILLRQIELVQPKLLFAVGRIAAQTLLESQTPIGKMRGKMHEHPASGVPVIVTYHPAYLLRSPLQKAKAWDDLKRVRDFLAQDV